MPRSASATSTSRLKYVAPNMVTCAGMLFGLFAILMTLEGRFEDAAWLILVCVLLDKLDGTVARLLNASSRFGVELDSFSDFLTFGMAPGILVMGLMTHPGSAYSQYWVGEGPVWFVRGACAFFIVMAALRLAKFNVMTDDIGKTLFLGVPTTLAGGMTATWVLTVWKYDLPDQTVAYFPIVLIILGLWMVSNIPMPKVRVTSSLAWNIFSGVNAALAYIFVPLRIFPEYLFGVAASYGLLGTAYAVFFMKDKPADAPAVAGEAGG